MSLELPNGRGAFLPQVPNTIQDKVIREYLIQAISAVEDNLHKQFDNSYYIISTGTTGTFLASGGAAITVTNGIITGLA